MYLALYGNWIVSQSHGLQIKHLTNRPHCFCLYYFGWLE